MKDVNDWVKPDRIAIHRSQRALRGFSDYDWWSFDTYISGVIATALEKFRDDGMGYPCEYTEEQWKMVLDIAIEGFELHATKFDWEWEDRFQNDKKVEIALDIFRGIYGSLWD